MISKTLRIQAAIRGAFVADAAEMGTHWIYDPSEMLEEVTSVDAPEFRSPPSPRWYSSDDFPGHYGDGMLSPYGEQLLFVAEYVASTMEGEVEGRAMSERMLEWAKTFGGRPDHATTLFVENMEKNDKPYPDCGADDDQAHMYMKVVPIVARYAGSSVLIDRLTQAIRVHQNNDRAVGFGIFAARILEAVILGAPLPEALASVEESISGDLGHLSEDVQSKIMEAYIWGKKTGLEKDRTLEDILLQWSHEVMKGQEDKPSYHFAGRSCATPGSFIGPIAILFKYASTPKAFVPAIRENILAAGDTCSRGIFIGAVLAASGGENSVPAEWIDKMNEDTRRKIEAAICSIAK